MASWNVSTHLTCVHKNKPFCWIFSEWENNEAQRQRQHIFCHSLLSWSLFTFWVRCLSASNHVVKKTLKLSLAFFSRELMTWGPLVDNEQWERCFWFDSDFLLEFCGKLFQNRARGNRKTLKSHISLLNSLKTNFKLKSCLEYLI